MSFYQITKSDGTTFNVYYLEENGPGNLSQPRDILATNLTGGAGSNNFTLFGDLTYRFASGFSFSVINSGSNDGTYTVGTGSYSTSSGYQIINVGGATTGTTSTGLVGTTTYTATIAVDGGAGQSISVLGSNATTFADLVTQINGQLTGATIFLVGGNLRVVSGTTSTSSTISITDGATNPLFGSLTGYVAIDTAVAGVVATGNTVILVTTAIPGTVLPLGSIQYSIPTAENATSLLLPGRGVQNYGNVILSDIVQVMENFANTSAPSYPTTGQTWYDTSSGATLKLYDGTNWTSYNNTAQNAAIYQSSNKVASPTTTVGNITATGTQIVGGYLIDSAVQTAAFTVTTDTATNILAAFPNAQVGTTILFRLINNDQSATGYSMTLVGGTGVTVTTIMTNPTIGQGQWYDFLFTFTDVTTPAITVTNVGGAQMLVPA